MPLTAALTPPPTVTGTTPSMRITGTPGGDKTEDGAPLVNLHRSNADSKVRDLDPITIVSSTNQVGGVTQPGVSLTVR